MGGCQEFCRWDELRDMGGRGLNHGLLEATQVASRVLTPPKFKGDDGDILNLLDDLIEVYGKLSLKLTLAP